MQFLEYLANSLCVFWLCFALGLFLLLVGSKFFLPYETTENQVINWASLSEKVKKQLNKDLDICSKRKETEIKTCLTERSNKRRAEKEKQREKERTWFNKLFQGEKNTNKQFEQEFEEALKACIKVGLSDKQIDDCIFERVDKRAEKEKQRTWFNRLFD